jgi:hypothetical protein
MRGNQYTAKKLGEARAGTRDATRFDQQDAAPSGWPEHQIVTLGTNSGLLEDVMKLLMRRPTQLEQPDEPYSGGMPEHPICR